MQLVLLGANVKSYFYVLRLSPRVQEAPEQTRERRPLLQGPQRHRVPEHMPDAPGELFRRRLLPWRLFLSLQRLEASDSARHRL